MGGSDTCELLVLDRSFDCVAPVAHEWTYEALLYDVCSDRINGNIIEQAYVTGAGMCWHKLQGASACCCDYTYMYIYVCSHSDG